MDHNSTILAESQGQFFVSIRIVYMVLLLFKNVLIVVVVNILANIFPRISLMIDHHVMRRYHLNLIQFLQTLRQNHLLRNLLISKSLEGFSLAWKQKGFLFLDFLLFCSNNTSKMRIKPFYSNFNRLCTLKWIIYGGLSHQKCRLSNSNRIRFCAFSKLRSKFTFLFQLLFVFSFFTHNFSLNLFFPSLISFKKGTFCAVLVCQRFPFCDQIRFKSAFLHLFNLIFDFFLQLLRLASSLLSLCYCVQMISDAQSTLTWFQLLGKSEHVLITCWCVLHVVIKIKSFVINQSLKFLTYSQIIMVLLTIGHLRLSLAIFDILRFVELITKSDKIS